MDRKQDKKKIALQNNFKIKTLYCSSRDGPHDGPKIYHQNNRLECGLDV